MTDLPTFADLVDYRTQACVLLLGNGASMAAWDGFAYDSLVDRLPQQHRELAELLRRVTGSTNVEQWLRTLDEMDGLAGHYSIDAATVERIENDRAALRVALTNTILETHPASYDDAAIHADVLDRLRMFTRIFTLSYDLLLYWSLAGNFASFSDGFWKVNGFLTYMERYPQRLIPVHWCHGGLHLFEHSGVGVTEKYVASSSTLIDQIRNGVSGGSPDPLVVLEGTHVQKATAVRNSYYLSSVFDRLRNAFGVVVTVGWAAAESDQHVADALLYGPSVERILVGCHEGNEAPVARLRTRAAALGKYKPIEPFDVASLPIFT